MKPLSKTAARVRVASFYRRMTLGSEKRSCTRRQIGGFPRSASAQCIFIEPDQVLRFTGERSGYLWQWVRMTMITSFWYENLDKDL